MAIAQMSVALSAKTRPSKAGSKRQRLLPAFVLITVRLHAAYHAAYMDLLQTILRPLFFATGLARRPQKIARPGASCVFFGNQP